MFDSTQESRDKKQTNDCVVSNRSEQGYSDNILIGFRVTDERLKQALHVC